jgi:hypothetical protein
MLVATIVAARWIIRRFHVSRTLPAMISMGMLAIGLLLAAGIGPQAQREQVSETEGSLVGFEAHADRECWRRKAF